MSVVVSIPAFAIYLLSNQGKKNTNQAPNTKRMITWLIKRKNEGLKTTDELIKYLEDKEIATSKPKLVVKDTVKPIEFSNLDKKEKVKTGVIGQIEKNEKTDQSINTSNATLLLYIGSSLVVFALFVFIAFNWDTFSNIIKSIILLLFIATFYASGVLLSLKETFRKAGLTFLTIAVIAFGLAGIGFWNFTLEEILPIAFKEYWLIHSITSLALFIITSRVFKIKKFIYLILFALYSSILSFTLTVTDVTYMRLAVFGVLNLGVYISSVATGEYKGLINTTSRVINQIVNLVGILNLFISLFDTNSFNDQLFLTILIFIPTLFSILVYFKEKLKIENHISIFSLPLKLLFVYLIWDKEVDFADLFIYLFLLYSMINVILGEVFKKRKNLNLHTSTIGTSWLLTGFTSLAYLVTSFATDSISSYTKILLLVTNSILLIVPNIVHKKKVLLPLSLSYLLFVFLSSIFDFMPKIESNIALLLLIASIPILGATHWVLNKKAKSPFNHSVLLLIELTTILSLLWSLFEGNLETTIAFGVASLLIHFLSKLHNKPKLQYLSVPINIIGFAALVSFISEIPMINIETFKGSLYLIPTLMYAFTLHRSIKNKERLHPNILGLFSFWVITMIFSANHEASYLISLCISLLYSVFAIFKYSQVKLSHLSYLFLLCIQWVILDILNANFDVFVLSTSIFSLVLAILCYTKTKNIIISGISKINALYSILSTGIVFILVLATITEPINHLLILSSLIGSLSLLLLRKHRKYISNFSGIGTTLAVWSYISTVDSEWFQTQLEILPLVLWGLTLALKYYFRKSFSISTTLEHGSYLIYFTTLLLQSVYSTTSIENTFTGIFLIGLSVFLLLFGLYRKNKELIGISIFFMFFELIIRLYEVILTIPWYIYVCLFGMSLLFLAIYLLWKVGKLNNNNEE